MNLVFSQSAYKWIRISLFNFFIVALAGVILRYKIILPLPIVNQKFLLDGHSHFAFAGWLTQILMTLIIDYLEQENVCSNKRYYQLLLWLNIITAYGMLLSFPFEGYAGISITFSTLSIFVSYAFAFFAWKDLSKTRDASLADKWFKAAIFLFVISSLGAFALAMFMATHAANQYWYFAALYLFLHFQYNGWFLFCCFGLFFYHLYKNGYLKTGYYSKRILRVLLITCFPAYLLSTLWMPLPSWLHIIADTAGIAQLFIFINIFKLQFAASRHYKKNLSIITKNLWVLSLIAFCIKIILQALSTIPLLTKFAFGFRPLVIGYLHLSFLGIITIFILGYCNEWLQKKQIHLNKKGLLFFVAGVLITELTLMIQGFGAIEFAYMPWANYVLFGAAILMLIGIGTIYFSINLKEKTISVPES